MSLSNATQRMHSPSINAVDAVLRQAKYFPEQEAFIYGDDTWDYARVVEEVRGFVRVLKAHGVGPGDRVVYLGLTSVNFLEIMLATWWLRAVFVPLNFRLSPGEIESLMERAAPKVSFVEPGHVDVMDKVSQIDTIADDGLLVVTDNDALAPLDKEVNPRY